ncbi:MAG: formylglycine-generating enzyme family protein [Bacteroides sp.]|nr:formylglycine-generating enzyme family protein [Bacteroides sp.]MCM1086094.1 formylglycine-generating enzyme family protein [Bacteroides sp.]
MKRLSLILPVVWAMLLLAACGNGSNTKPKRGRNFTEVSVPGLNLKMVYVEGGSFQMGATAEQVGDAEEDEFPVHKVTLSPYYIGKYEVTQAQWKAVMGNENNPSEFEGENRPVENVSWSEAQHFCEELSALTGRTYRLPTEAEWEYAARGGKKSKGYKYSGSPDIEEVAWYIGNSGSATHVVGMKKPNELGIYDMSGNVWEWCLDRYGSYDEDAVENPTGSASGSARVFRGGSWYNYAKYCRVAYRRCYNPGFRGDYRLGFRVVLVP